jgi:hypothetical protein
VVFRRNKAHETLPEGDAKQQAFAMRQQAEFNQKLAEVNNVILGSLEKDAIKRGESEAETDHRRTPRGVGCGRCLPARSVGGPVAPQ